MNNNRIRITTGILLLLFLFVSVTGCARSSLLSPAAPVTLTIWHVYGEQADAPMNLLIEEFNETVGKKKGIRLLVTNVTSTSKLLAQLQDAIAGKPGALELPDLFSCHTQNAMTLGAENLVDFGEWFSARELSGYVPEFLESGRIDGRLVVFPVTKSTYALFLNGSQFARFSADTGVTYDDLSDWNGFFDAAAKYHTWSGGKPFCAFDYLVRHMELDILSKRGTLDYTESGWYDTADAEFEASFTMFAEAIAKGHIAVSDLYANTQIMTGEVLAVFGDDVVIEHAGVIGQQKRQPADEENRGIDDHGQAGWLRAARQAAEHHPRAEAARKRRYEHRDGETADHAARAGEKTAIERQLGPQPQRAGKEKAPYHAAKERASVRLDVRAAHGQIAAQQQQRAQRAAAEDGGVRVDGRQIRRSNGCKEHCSQRGRGGIAPEQGHGIASCKIGMNARRGGSVGGHETGQT